MINESIQQILIILDKEYGTTKEGFLHYADWQLLLAIMLSAQSTDKQVNEVLPGLWNRFSSICQMAEAPVEEIEDQIRSIGLYKSKAKNMKQCCKQVIDEYGGKVPTTINELVKLSGVGRKSATLFLADAYDIPGVTVDTHVLRIAKRLGWAEGKNPVQVEQELMKILPKENWNRINFQLIYHGRSVCTARKCYCERCLLNQWCEKKRCCYRY
ncbi:endonuclease III [Lachnoclostridium phytofermentans]|uniref:Endonuclease III n=1 Tax=Lachnoclostridium phytofermentans (strain ATCC 700394 / DSM 18823 / ISDg) TaxID=357809 RepID=A9KLZ9_LACP7|nr:endonuclease III [Lachnoclostridium phytofermentans]ABX41342.1 DNA-(apurinic or apyrimidinic site) lyase [Lachnoclostridium phytofermentans ISDg]